jgi:hypothetical protein
MAAPKTARGAGAGKGGDPCAHARLLGLFIPHGQ